MSLKSFAKNGDYGFYEVQPKPSEGELRDYYAEKYYQHEHATYAKEYLDKELVYFNNKIAQKAFVVEQFLNNPLKPGLLDIGCGEGFTMEFYREKGWEITGVDFSDFGLKGIHPHLVSNLKKGNVFDEIQKLVQSGKQYDVVWLDNVLEHVIDPVVLLQQCQKLTKRGGVLVIEVPNDYSGFQMGLIEKDKVERNYWEAYPDHLNYFSFQSLKNICEAQGWATEKIIADFPIEWYLPNPNSNYVKDKTVGKAAHQSRMFIENFMHQSQKDNLAQLIDLYEAMAKVGQGRQLIGFFTKK